MAAPMIMVKNVFVTPQFRPRGVGEMGAWAALLVMCLKREKRFRIAENFLAILVAKGLCRFAA